MADGGAGVMYGDLTIGTQDGRPVVVAADDLVCVCLEVIAQTDSRWLQVQRDSLTILTDPPVAYDVVGWDGQVGGLVCQRVPE